MVYSILDNIKGKSIFGKEDPYEVPVTNNPFRKPPSEDSPEAQSVPGTSESTPMDTQPDSDDSILMAGKEHLFQKKLKVREKKKGSEPPLVLPQDENPFHNVELFPFGTHTYI